MLKRWIIAQFLFGICTHAASAARPFESVDVELLQSEMAAHLEAQVKTYGEPFITFNYEQEKNLHLPPNAKLPEAYELALDHVKAHARQFWDLKITGTARDLGKFGGVNRQTWSPGLYLALDPVISQPYGTSDANHFGTLDFALYIISLPKDFRYLDIEDREQKWPSTISKKLSQFGCNGEQGQRVQTVFMSNEIQACREIGLAVLQKLKVDGVQYPFGSRSFANCGLSLKAILLINEKLLSPDTVKFLDRKIPRNDPNALDRRVIEALTRENGFGETTLWPHLMPASKSETRDWLQSNIVLCRGGKTSSTERN